MLIALAATLAIVVQDQASLRASPRSTATELATFWQGDIVEIRGEQADYLKVYNYRRERGGYLKRDAARTVSLTEADAPDLLAVTRFLRETPGSESLGISYGAAYLRAVPAQALTAEPFDAIGRMAERLADAASGRASRLTDVAARLEVVREFGVHMQTFERNGRMQVCYDGEMFRRVLAMPGASAEERAHAVLALTRPDCIDPGIGPTMRTAVDAERRELLDQIDESEEALNRRAAGERKAGAAREWKANAAGEWRASAAGERKASAAGTINMSAVTRSRLRARRAGVWAAFAFEQARHGESSNASAQRALAELAGVNANELGEDRRSEYADAALRVSAIRWAVTEPRAHATTTSLRVATTTTTATGVAPTITLGGLSLTLASGEPGQTCITLRDSRGPRVAPPLQRCTYGVVWMGSAQTIAQGSALVLAVQPLEGWRELWVFQKKAAAWKVDVLSPGATDPEQGYIDFAGYVPNVRHLLVVREFKEGGRYRKRFEELRMDDFALVRQASAPELLRNFGKWQDVNWRRETLALR